MLLVLFLFCFLHYVFILYADLKNLLMRIFCCINHMDTSSHDLALPLFFFNEFFYRFYLDQLLFFKNYCCKSLLFCKFNPSFKYFIQSFIRYLKVITNFKGKVYKIQNHISYLCHIQGFSIKNPPHFFKPIVFQNFLVCFYFIQLD